MFGEGQVGSVGVGMAVHVANQVERKAAVELGFGDFWCRLS